MATSGSGVEVRRDDDDDDDDDGRECSHRFRVDDDSYSVMVFNCPDGCGFNYSPAQLM